MRILLATYEYPPDLGGVAAYLGGLFSRVPDVRILRLPQPRLPLAWLLRLPRLWWAARSADAVVVSHLLPLGTAAMLIGKPYAIIAHGLDLRSATAHPRRRRLAARVLKRAKLIAVNSRATASELPAFGVDSAAVLVLTPGVDDVAAGETTPSDGRKIVLGVGRFVKRKGFDRLIRLLPELRASCGDVELVLAGSGPEGANLHCEAERAGVAEHVRFVEAPGREELHALYRAAHVFAMPVREVPGDVEGFGIVFLEAALFGLPAVATRTGGVPEAIEDGVTGLLADPDSDADVFGALCRLLKDGDEARRFGAAGRARALREFRWDDRARLFLERLA